jgi:TolA-binding protein
MIRSFLLVTLLVASTLSAEFLFDGPNLHYRTLKTAEEEFELAKESWKKGDFNAALISFEAISQHYPRSTLANESSFRAAQCLYRMNELESANEKISIYLKSQSAPAHFKDAIVLKFQIAEKFRLGVAGKPIFGIRYLPKWLGGELLALEIYDEISTILPSDPIAAKAIYSKGLLLKEIGRWQESTDAFQHVIRRFPKDALASDSYAMTSEVLRMQGELEAQNPDILGLARVNLKRFEMDFPQDERIASVKKGVLELEETYAEALFETGMLYERKGEPEAAQIYYKNTCFLFPETKVANLSQIRLKRLEKEIIASVPTEKTQE